MTASPSANSPARTRRVSSFSTRRWIVRRSGRALNAGAKPSSTSAAFAEVGSRLQAIEAELADVRSRRVASLSLIFRRQRPRRGCRRTALRLQLTRNLSSFVAGPAVSSLLGIWRLRFEQFEL